MPFLSSLPDDAGVRHILRLHPSAGRALIELHCAVLREDSQLTAAHKELIAAYVSGLNGCQYCFGVHQETAKAFGVDESLLQALFDDVEQAPVDTRLRPLLVYARKLTLAPNRATQQDVDAVLGAGWTERDLHDAILTVCLFNFMNRLLDGHGVKGGPALYVERGHALKESGYSPLLAWLQDSPANAERDAQAHG